MTASLPQQTDPAGSTRNIAAFLGLIAIIPILGFQFGYGNQVEQFALIERMKDPAFAAGDFYIDSAATFGPRYYYAAFMTALARVMPLPAVVFILTLLCNFATAWATYAAARRILDVGAFAGAAAAALAVTNSSLSLGLAGFIRFDSFQPASIALPLSLFSIYALISGRCVLAAIGFSLSALFHPLIGVETGVIAFAAYFLATLRLNWGEAGFWRDLSGQVGAGLIFVGLVFAAWGVPSLQSTAPSIPSEEFFSILPVFRAPHHYLPFSFPLSHYVAALLFVAASGVIAFKYSLEHAIDRRHMALGLMAAIVGVLCAVTIVAVEFFDSAFWASAQIFRLVYLVKWIGFLFVGWQAALWLAEKNPVGLIFGALIITGPSDAQPFILALCLFAKVLISFFSFRGSLAAAVVSGVIALSAFFVLKFSAYTDFVRALAALACLYLVFVRFPVRRAGFVLASVIIAALITFALVNRAANWTPLKAFHPSFTWADIRSPDADIARWAEANTPEGEVWMTPPEFEAFRLFAKRGVLVDFTSVPFQNLALREWKRRMTDLYGDVEGRGFDAVDAMTANYVAFTPAELRERMAAYNVEYAVLYAETAWDGPVLYNNGTFKAVMR